MLQERGMNGACARLSRFALVVLVVVLASAAGASSAGAVTIGNVRVTRTVREAPLVSPEENGTKIPHFGTLHLNKVGILKIAPVGKKADNVLVLEPGTSAAAAYFVPFAKSLLEDPELKGWQVWAVERRENFLENQKELTRYKAGKVSSEEFFNYYLGHLDNPSVTNHYIAAPESKVRVRKGLGYERRGRRPQRRDRRSQEARRQGRARRPLARRLGRHRIRHLGLRRQTGGRRPLRASSTTTVAAARLRSRRKKRKRRWPNSTNRRKPRGWRSAGSRRPTWGCSPRPARRSRSSNQKAARCSKASCSCRPTCARRSRRSPTKRDSATRSTSAPHPNR